LGGGCGRRLWAAAHVNHDFVLTGVGGCLVRVRVRVRVRVKGRVRVRVRV